MASIKKRPSGSWRARYRDAAGHEHASHFPRKVDAQRWLDEQAAGLVTGQWIDPRDGKITFREFAEGWRSSRVERPETARVVENVLRVHAYPAFGDRPLSTIRPSDVQGLVAGMTRDGLAPRTVHRAWAFVASVFKSAVADRVIASTPCRNITLPKIDDTEVHPPTADTVAAVADAIEPHLRPLVIMLAGSGLRISEALALRVGDLDWLRRTVRVSRQVGRDGSDAPTKSARSTARCRSRNASSTSWRPASPPAVETTTLPLDCSPRWTVRRSRTRRGLRHGTRPERRSGSRPSGLTTCATSRRRP